MKIELENIGCDRDISIDINGITVILGNNSSGKSTLGKALYSSMKSLMDFQKRAYTLKYRSIERLAVPLSFQGKDFFEREDNFEAIKIFIEEICKENNVDRLQNKVREFCRQFKVSEEEEEIFLRKVKTIVFINNETAINNIFNIELSKEFGNQISNIYSDNKKSCIKLSIRNQEVKIDIEDERVVNVKNPQFINLSPIYMDNYDSKLITNKIWSLMVDGEELGLSDHNTDLYVLLDKIISDDQKMIGMIEEKRISPIIKKIATVCDGRLGRDDNGRGCFKDRENPKKQISLFNLSSGMKAFAVIQELILCGALTDKSTIILDEPEIHLHPAWQVTLAEVLVMLQKEYSLHMLISTHSPYFLSAIDVFSQKYEVANNSKYYYFERKNHEVTAHDVSNDLSLVYQEMAEPLQRIEDIGQE